MVPRKTVVRGARLTGAAIAFPLLVLGPASGAAPPRFAALRTVDPTLTQIVTPRSGSIVGHTTVRVVIRVKPAVTSFRARIDATVDITPFFRGGPAGTRIADLRLGRGIHYLHVDTTGRGPTEDFDSVRFLVGRASKGLVSVSVRRPRLASGRIWVLVQTTRRGAFLRLRLNGHAVALPKRTRRSWSGIIDGDAGVRHGKNALVATAYTTSGRFSTVRRGFTIRAREVIPAAGPNRRGVVGRAVRIDARRTHSDGGRLRFRWVVRGGPRGAHPMLHGQGTATPRLVTDRPGRYRLTLRASGPAHQLTTDSVLVSTAPDVPPVGVAINTMNSSVAGPAGIALGAPVNQSFTTVNAGDVAQVLVLDRATLAVLSHTSYPATDAGMAALATEVDAQGNNTLVVIDTPQLSAVVLPDQTAANSLNRALAHIDVPAVGTWLRAMSAIGVPGGGPGVENPGLNLASPSTATSDPGALRGYLQVDSAQNFTFVSSDYVPFDTVAPGTSPTQAAISVGGQSYTSSPVTSPAGGFYVLILDSGTLAKLADGTFPVPSGLAAMHSLLSQHVLNTHALIFTQSIGSVTRADASPAAWNLVASDEQQIGGHRFLFDALPAGGHGDYALVAPTGNGSPGCCISPWADIESYAATRGAGRVTGVLARNGLAQYYPALSGSHPGIANSLPSVAYEPPSAGPFSCPDLGSAAPATGAFGVAAVWPCRDTAARRAAITCVAAVLGLPEPIERNYWAAGNVTWSDELSQLETMRYSGLAHDAGCDEKRFTAQDFGDVQSQLEAEFRDVDRVLTGSQNLISNLQKPLTQTQGTTYANLEQIASTIAASVKPPPASFSFDPYSIIAGLLDLGSEVAGEPIGTVLGFYGTLTLLASDTVDHANGSEVTTSPIPAKAADLGAQLETTYLNDNTRMTHIGEILVSDWGKLKAAASNAGPSGPWNWTPAMNQLAINAITAATTQAAYKSLFPLAFTFYNVVDNTHPEPNAAVGSGSTGSSVPSTASAFKCAKDYVPPFHSLSYNVFAPFRGEPANGQLSVITGAGPGRQLWALGTLSHYFLNGRNAQDTTGTPPSSLTNAMFGNAPIDPTAPLGLLRYGIDTYSPTQIPPTLTNNGPPSKIANDIDDGTALFGDYCTVNGKP